MIDAPDGRGLIKKRAMEAGKEYTCFVFKDAHVQRAWAMFASLACIDKNATESLQAFLQTFSAHVKAVHSAELKPQGKWNWASSTFGGASLWPRSERALLLPLGDEMDPGRLSERPDVHSMLETIHEAHRMRYNAVPEVTLLDVKERNAYRVDWHDADDLPSATYWEVGFFLRVYRSTRSTTMGLSFVLESLTAHGQSPLPTMVSPLPLSRKRSFFADEDSRGAKKAGGPVRA